MAKILVTGGAGFIGSHVVDLFISQGYKICEGRHTYITPDKAQRDWGWVPTISLEDGLRETVEYFKTLEKAT